MKWLDLTTIKAHCRIDVDTEDDLLTTYGESAEEVVLQILNRTYNDLLLKYGSVPIPVQQATLMLVDLSYQYRSPIGPSQLYVVPYTFDLLLKPYMKL